MPFHKKVFNIGKSFIPFGAGALIPDLGGAPSGAFSISRKAARRLHRGHGHTWPKGQVLAHHAGNIRPRPSRAIARQPTQRTTTARVTPESVMQIEVAKATKFPLSETVGTIIDQIINPGDCGFGRVWDEVKGTCVFGLGEQAGRDDTPIGDTVMGRYGAGEQPGNMVVNRAICRPGMVLGDDGVCYNRSQISNKQREWPRGRRPLLTGGDMRAISTAARAGKRLEGATKRLQKIGLMKKPSRGASRRQIAAEIHHSK